MGHVEGLDVAAAGAADPVHELHATKTVRPERPEREPAKVSATDGTAHAGEAKRSSNAEAGAMTTGDLARACETTVRTVRFYEEAGVLSPETRSEGGHRLFGVDELQKLQLVMDLREAGLSLHDIKGLFEFKGRCETPREATRQLAEALEPQIEEMQRKITALCRLRDDLTATLTTADSCRTCTTPGFPASCGDCEVMKRDSLPRAMRLFWAS
jgi:DNA-binding transcriptional MerR regulator